LRKNIVFSNFAPPNSHQKGQSMASFSRRGKTWRVEISYKGDRLTATFPSKTEAKEWANRKETEIKSYRTGKLGKLKTVGDAFQKYADEVSIKKRGARWEKIRLTALQRAKIADIRLTDLQPADIASWRDNRLKEVSQASVRREMGLMGSVFNICCREWNWLAENPTSTVNRPKDSKARFRRIGDAEIAAITTATNYQLGTAIKTKTQLVGAFFLLAIETGMRLGEICSLEAEQVHLEKGYLRLLETKNSDARAVGLSKKAVAIMRDILAAQIPISASVASTLFRKVRDRITEDENNIDIIDLKFHDTRHEGTTRLAKKLEILDLAKQIGHRDLKSLMIYYNPTPEEIAAQLD
jgi:integrase